MEVWQHLFSRLLLGISRQCVLKTINSWIKSKWLHFSNMYRSRSFFVAIRWVTIRNNGGCWTLGEIGLCLYANGFVVFETQINEGVFSIFLFFPPTTMVVILTFIFYVYDKQSCNANTAQRRESTCTETRHIWVYIHIYDFFLLGRGFVRGLQYTLLFFQARARFECK